MRRHILVVAGFVMLISTMSSCKKNTSEPGCVSVHSKSDLNPVPVTTLRQPFMSCFNPNSDDECVFLYANEGGSRTLATGNLSTKAVYALQTAQWSSAPQWGTNGWILFNSTESGVCKIRASGDSLTVLPKLNYVSAAPAWNYDCSGIISHSSTGILRSDANGNPTDTLTDCPATYNPLRFLDPTTIITYTLLPGAQNWEGSIGYYSTTDRQYHRLADCNYKHVVSPASINADEFIWADENGIYLTNKRKGTTERLRETCDAVLYESPSINRSRTKILWTKSVMSSPDGFTLKIDYQLVTTDLRGGNEQIVRLEL